MQLHGLHHITAVTGDVHANLRFYTQTLGLRLVKRTVNQDDVSAYHLFYGDKLASPGFDMTFFDWPRTPQETRGTDSISRTLFRVDGQAALDYWAARFARLGVQHSPQESFAGRAILSFEDPEGQRLALVDDGGAPFEGEPWDGGDVPVEHSLRGFHAAALSVPDAARMAPIFTQLLGFARAETLPSPDSPGETVTIYTMDGGGPGKEIHVYEQPGARRARPGRGGVHHAAFRVADAAEQQWWLERLNSMGVPNSGLVERYYFKSLYFRISSGILFELATDGPGFAVDEPLESLGERLALPPFLEPRRAEIEAGLRPI